MARTHRVTGDLTLDPTGNLVVSSDTQITGNLTVIGTTTTVSSTDTAIADRQIVLNSGETGSGVTGRFSGIEVERGSLDNALIVFDENDDAWKTSTDGGSSYQVRMFNVRDDTTPQLGGDLDVQGNNIVTATSNADIHLIPNGSGRVTIEGPIKLNDQTSAPSAATGATVIYSTTASGGGTGIFFVDGSTTDELVSKAKSIAYALVF